jgi:hypothetical protein
MDESDQQKNSEKDNTLSIEDLTVMKLMEEIIEFEEEIKLKQKFINARMNFLH